MDFLNPPQESVSTSIGPLSYATVTAPRSQCGRDCGPSQPLEEYALSQESVWGFLWVLVVRQAVGGQKFVTIAAGAAYTWGLTTAGVIYCWGRGFDGELGTGYLDNQYAPVPVMVP
jgi:hypothetical protein